MVPLCKIQCDSMLKNFHSINIKNLNEWIQHIKIVGNHSISVNHIHGFTYMNISY